MNQYPPSRSALGMPQRKAANVSRSTLYLERLTKPIIQIKACVSFLKRSASRIS
ncbi:unnamed protein product [Linum tenue]|uniref:Uncharacterized protein n=1 Tax=Linum tenue TaxID=586396 RepID=A0AAV0KY19_9ROSI|nr:unnamed protein product [Linum tenue]CAI0425966.1 unnamed protein product [Linum tenue]